MSKGVLTKTKVAVFPRESKKRKCNNDGKHDHGQEKRRSSTYVERKLQRIKQNLSKINQYIYIYTISDIHIYIYLYYYILLLYIIIIYYIGK